MLKAIDEWMFGGARSNDRRVEERHAMDMKRMQSLLDSASGQIVLNKARAASLDRGEGYSGAGRVVNPYVQGSEDLGKVRAARDKFTEEELSPETVAYFDAAEKSVLDRMNVPEVAVPLVDETGRRRGDSSGPETSKHAAEYFEPSKSAAEHFQPPSAGKAAVTESDGIHGKLKTVLEKMPLLSDYFQAPTDTVPEENIPKTFQQLGISNIDDQATLQEMQNALPDVDMKESYENEPENMKRLMELWRKKKIKKKDLHKYFTMIQQSAKQSLGIA